MKINSFFRSTGSGWILAPILLGIFLIFAQATANLAQAEVIDVYLDIKPCRCPNPLNVEVKGILSVAILGTDGFDVSAIDPASIRLEGVAPIRSSIEDVATPYKYDPENCYDCWEKGPDYVEDLKLKFNAQAVVAELPEVSDGECIELLIEGNLEDGTPIEGRDWVLIRIRGKN